MIRWCDNGHDPIRVVSGQRCRACAKRRESTRATPAMRGYGAQHAAARRALALTLPSVCGYEHDARCPRTLIHPGTQWVAAHVVDGDPSAGWMAAHPACNERAKVRVG